MRRTVIFSAAALLLGTASLASAEDLDIKKYEIQIPPEAYVSYDGAFKTVFPHGFPIGAGSGLKFEGWDKDGALVFLGIGDRGPNADSPSHEDKPGGQALPAKIFPSPDFTPQFGRIKVDDARASLVSTTTILAADNTPISGRPLPEGKIGSTGETALDDRLDVLPMDAEGLDPEGIDLDKKDGQLWICDEYGPFIVKLDKKTGREIKKFGPGTGLPEILAKRQPNRGFEGLAVTPGNKVYAVVQSILDINGQVKKSAAPLVRIVELDPETGAVRQFAYPHDVEVYAKSADAKIGDLEAIDDHKFLIIEQGADKDKKMRNIVYLIDISDASDINGALLPNGRELEEAENRGTLEGLKIKFVKKTKLFDLAELGWTPEKAEGLALLDDGQTMALVSDNDFGLALKLENPAVDDKGKKVKKPTDYTVGPDKKLRYEGRETGTTLALEPNNESSVLWLVTMPKKLAEY
ncbi:MAG: esterase-like activity of phytase family protein [Pseudomonadota bacterium]